MGQLKLMILKWLSSSQIWLCLHLPVTPPSSDVCSTCERFGAENVLEALSRDPPCSLCYQLTRRVSNSADDIRVERENSELNVLCNCARLTRPARGHNKEKEEG